MVSGLSKILSFVRDAIVFSFSIVVIINTWGAWVNEPAVYVLDGFGAVFIALAVADVVLLIRNVQWRAFYFGNAIYQMFPSFVLVGALPSYGLVLMTLNLLVLFSLKENPQPPAMPAEGPKTP